MNLPHTPFRAAFAALILLPLGAFAADTGDSAPSDKEAAATGRTFAPPPPSIIEHKLMDITEDEEKVFAEMTSGQLQQEEFERRVVAIAYRYDELVARDPNNVETLILYGKFLRRLGKNTEANGFFVHADHISPNIAVVKQQIGNYLAEEGNYAEALKYYRKAIELEPKEAVYHYGLGELVATFRDKYVANGTFSEKEAEDKLMAEFAKACELDPANKDFAFRRGEAFYDVADPDWNAALALWIEMAERTNLTPYERDAVRLHTARVYCELGRGREARELLLADVVPILGATRARLLKRLSQDNNPDDDKANVEITAPSIPEAEAKK